jgi:hypothetical protein
MKFDVLSSNQNFIYKYKDLNESNITDSTIVFGLFTKENPLIGYTKSRKFDLLKLLTFLQDPTIDYESFDYEIWVFFGSSGSGKTTSTYRFLGKKLIKGKVLRFYYEIY